MTTERVKFADVDEFEGEHARVVREIDNREIVVFEVDGEFHALLNYCIHEGAPLCEGSVSGAVTVGDDEWTLEYDGDRPTVACPWHEWTYDLETGENVLDPEYAVPSFDTVVEDGEVFVRL
jgi:nitrite reductase/ring-hydroxylating ferredoxin subunit